MKKIIALVLVILTIAGCQMYKTKDVAIENKSNYAAIIEVKNFKENDKKILSSAITIPAHKSILLPIYHDGNISLNTGRNTLKQISDNHYEILDVSSVNFTIYNRTNEAISVKDSHNLFDGIASIPALGNTSALVYNPEKLQIYAWVTGTAIPLKVLTDIGAKKIIITY